MSAYERTSNGVSYELCCLRPDGGHFILFREARHTDEQIETARRELYNDRDVVKLEVNYSDAA